MSALKSIDYCLYNYYACIQYMSFSIHCVSFNFQAVDQQWEQYFTNYKGIDKDKLAVMPKDKVVEKELGLDSKKVLREVNRHPGQNEVRMFTYIKLMCTIICSAHCYILKCISILLFVCIFRSVWLYIKVHFDITFCLYIYGYNYIEVHFDITFCLYI